MTLQFNISPIISSVKFYQTVLSATLLLMQSPTRREEQLIQLIHKNVLLAVVAIVLIGGIIVLGFFRKGILSPIVGNPDNGFTLIWKVSDHTLEGDLLINRISGTNDSPFYDDELVTEIQLNSDGSLRALPRLQGELNYYKNNP